MALIIALNWSFMIAGIARAWAVKRRGNLQSCTDGRWLVVNRFAVERLALAYSTLNCIVARSLEVAPWSLATLLQLTCPPWVWLTLTNGRATCWRSASARMNWKRLILQAKRAPPCSFLAALLCLEAALERRRRHDSLLGPSSAGRGGTFTVGCNGLRALDQEFGGAVKAALEDGFAGKQVHCPVVDMANWDSRAFAHGSCMADTFC